MPALTTNRSESPSLSARAGSRATAALARLFRPSSSAASATLLLSFSTIASGLLGLVRSKYIAYVFGVSPTTDAYLDAFRLPETISYFMVGGVASITLVGILSRYREAGDDEGADRALSVVLLAMLAVLGTGIVLAMIFAPVYTRYAFPRLDEPTKVLCTHLTRIVLPAQLFFFAGGVLGSRLLVRKVFTYQAFQPLVYNASIILGGVLLSRQLGIDGLAWGALAGSLIGALVLNGVGAFRSGLRFYPIFNLRHPAFLEWLKLSLPLILGVSLAMADNWIISYFASGQKGATTLLTNAKQLFNQPLSLIGYTAGAASMPFFSALFAQGKTFEFNMAVCKSVSRLLAASMLVTALMLALAGPTLDLFRGGTYTAEDAALTALYFALFSLSLAFWSAQSIYSRAFYAARNTLTPAISGTVVTLVSIPMYSLLWNHYGVAGLAVASDLGILTHTLALALLLHRARLVSVATLEYGELLRALIAALVGFAGAYGLVFVLPHRAHAGYVMDGLTILLGTAVWAALSLSTLRLLGSALPQQLLRRRGK